MAANRLNSPELHDLADLILANADKIREADIKPAYDELYDLNNGAEPRDIVNAVKQILKI